MSGVFKFLKTAFFLTLIWLFTLPVLAAEGDILLFDDFNDGNFNGWTVESGNWSVNNGNLFTTQTGVFSFLGEIHTGSDWDNYRVELDIDNESGIDEGIEFRKNGNTHYTFNLRHGTGNFDTPEIKLFKAINGVDTLLTSTHSQSLFNNTWYHIKIEVLNENIKLWVNNTLTVDYTDPGTTLKKGGIGLQSWTGANGFIRLRFDNITITALAPPSTKTPLIFIPGIGGSELKAAQDIIWSKDDGHGGTFSHAYPASEKVWVNQDEATKFGDDDYFDVLRLKEDGVTPEADLSLTGSLTSFGYSDIEPFFESLGYTKNIDFFIFPYDWRKDIQTTKNSLDNLIETAKTTSGKSQVNIVAHSMGGLVARYYISDPTKAVKVTSLIELGVPHLGAPSALKTLIYGEPIGRWYFKFINIGVNASEVKDVVKNLPSHHSLIPSQKYYDFYNNSDISHPYPFQDKRDVDQNSIKGDLNYSQTKTLLSNLGHNMTAFGLSEQFHNSLDPDLAQTNGVKIYEIAGSSQPTLGQIQETWWITWPFNILPKRDQVFINGDDTVPLYSASLKNDSIDLSGGATIYYVDQKHSDLVSGNGAAMQAVRSILNADNAIPVEVKSEKIVLEGNDISVDQDASLDIYDESNNHTGLKTDGTAETNIPNTFYDSIEDTKHIFIKKSAKKVTAKVTSQKPVKAKIKIKTYTQDTVSKATLYNDVNLDTVSSALFTVDPANTAAPIISINDQTIPPGVEVSGSFSADQIPPQTSIALIGTRKENSWFTGDVLIVLQATDQTNESGVLKTEYSLDNGQTVHTYLNPFRVSTEGISNLIVKSTDKSGNEELPKQAEIKIDKTLLGTNMCRQ